MGYCPKNVPKFSVCRGQWTALGNRCYLFLEGEMNWHMAKAACKERSGYLVEVDSHDENILLVAEKKRRNLRHLWIGLNDVDDEGVWRWSQYRRQAVFTAFGYNGPNTDRYQQKHCVALNSQHEWENLNCYRSSTSSSSSKQYHIGAICEK